MNFRLACTILGIAETATRDELRQRYRLLALVWHPDRIKNPVMSERAGHEMAKINEAYEVAKAYDPRDRESEPEPPRPQPQPQSQPEPTPRVRTPRVRPSRPAGESAPEPPRKPNPFTVFCGRHSLKDTRLVCHVCKALVCYRCSRVTPEGFYRCTACR